jgi:hypothetical protein
MIHFANQFQRFNFRNAVKSIKHYFEKTIVIGEGKVKNDPKEDANTIHCIQVGIYSIKSGGGL